MASYAFMLTPSCIEVQVAEWLMRRQSKRICGTVQIESQMPRLRASCKLFNPLASAPAPYGITRSGERSYFGAHHEILEEALLHTVVSVREKLPLAVYCDNADSYGGSELECNQQQRGCSPERFIGATYGSCR